MIASVIVSAKTLVLSNSLSPPTEPLDAISKAQLPVLQVPLAETQQFDVCFFERDVSSYVWFENYQSVMPDTDVGYAVNFQVLTNPNYARASFGKSDILLAAISPNCRAVMLNDFLESLINRNVVVKTQATSPNCRDVLLLS